MVGLNSRLLHFHVFYHLQVAATLTEPEDVELSLSDDLDTYIRLLSDDSPFILPKMRLIDVKILQPIERYGDSIPPYAILSHTWGDQEVTLQEIQSPTQNIRNKEGWLKIEQACKITRAHRLGFLWVDTCCIDKTNSVELGEAINSMFQWYKNSDMCIAYLADLEPQERYSDQAIFACRWWQRGWTLQELIAPRSLRFYDATWQDNDSKSDWEEQILAQVGIPPRALHGNLSTDVASVAQKFSWAAGRKTTRLEDEAYCLLGLFDVNLPLLYGEGPKAFRRLQEEIIRNGDDLTIFAHSPLQQTGNLFADHVSSFRNMGDVRPFYCNDMTEFSLTNRGLYIKRGLEVSYASVLERGDNESHDSYYAWLGHRAKSDIRVGICLAKIAPQVYCRDSTRVLVGFGSRIRQYKGNRWELTDCYILRHSNHGIFNQYDNAIYLSSTSIGEDFGETLGLDMMPATNVKMSIHDVVPRGMYHHAQRLIVKRESRSYPADQNVIALRGSVNLDEHPGEPSAAITVVILVDFVNFEPRSFVFQAAQHQRLHDFLFSQENLETSITWQFLRILYPQVEQFDSSFPVRLDSGRRMKFSTFFRESQSSNPQLESVGTHTLEVDLTNL